MFELMNFVLSFIAIIYYLADGVIIFYKNYYESINLVYNEFFGSDIDVITRCLI